MSRACTICAHPKRREIEGASLSGQSARSVACAHRLSRYAIARHMDAHIPARMAKAVERKEVEAGRDLVERLAELNRISRAILADAYKAGERDVALRAISRLESQLELEARLIGELRDREINVAGVVVDPETAEKMARMYLMRRGALDANVSEAIEVGESPDGAQADNSEEREEREQR